MVECYLTGATITHVSDYTGILLVHLKGISDSYCLGKLSSVKESTGSGLRTEEENSGNEKDEVPSLINILRDWG